MAAEQGRARALVAMDLIGLVACVAMLIGAASMSGASNVQLLPQHACPALVAMDLYKAQRIAATSDRAVRVEFQTNAAGQASGYRIDGPAVRMQAYGLPASREFHTPAQASRGEITFLTNGRTDGAFQLNMPGAAGRQNVVVEASGVVRLLER